MTQMRTADTALFVGNSPTALNSKLLKHTERAVLVLARQHHQVALRRPLVFPRLRSRPGTKFKTAGSLWSLLGRSCEGPKDLILSVSSFHVAAASDGPVVAKRGIERRRSGQSLEQACESLTVL